MQAKSAIDLVEFNGNSLNKTIIYLPNSPIYLNSNFQVLNNTLHSISLLDKKAGHFLLPISIIFIYIHIIYVRFQIQINYELVVLVVFRI